MKEFFTDMKNLMSIGVLAVFIYAAVTGIIDSDQINTIVVMAFTFFFGSKIVKS